MYLSYFLEMKIEKQFIHLLGVFIQGIPVHDKGPVCRFPATTNSKKDRRGAQLCSLTAGGGAVVEQLEMIKHCHGYQEALPLPYQEQRNSTIAVGISMGLSGSVGFLGPFFLYFAKSSVLGLLKNWFRAALW